MKLLCMLGFHKYWDWRQICPGYERQVCNHCLQGRSRMTTFNTLDFIANNEARREYQHFAWKWSTSWRRQLSYSENKVVKKYIKTMDAILEE